jgi:hypothetical protein
LCCPTSLGVVEAQPRFACSAYVFAGRGERPFSGFSKAKAALDKASGVVDWTLHDLRRTARTLLSRVGVSEGHAERVLGHAIGGVKGVYDRWQYREERRIALAKLATLLDGILNPRGNVVPLAPKGERGHRSASPPTRRVFVFLVVRSPRINPESQGFARA